MARYVGYRSGGVMNFGDGFGPPPPRDILALLGVLFFTYTLSFLPFARSFVGLLHLSPDVWQRGYLWQLVTYAFVPFTSPLWFLVSLLIIFLFGRDVFRALGRKEFWRLLMTSVVSASVVAVGVQLLMNLAGARGALALVLMRGGDEILLTVLIAAFAVIYPGAMIHLFFVLPIRARYFIALELVIAFVLGFLPTLDLAGFLGICTAIAVTWAQLTGGVRRSIRELRLRIERRILEWRLQRMRKKRGMRLVKDDEDEGGDVHQGPWVH